MDAASRRLDRLAGVTATTTITSAGELHATHLVQLYGRARVEGILPRRAVLLGFTRVGVEPGESRTVSVAIEPDAIQGLGLDAGRRGSLQLWLSIDGATVGNGEPDGAAVLELEQPLS